MRIGELAERAGRTQRTLHFYEELGLLTPVSRTKGGFRL
ncbi:MAG: MerR family DNA-binding transcriptional regulator, partial [Deltaproteobacteria bacterium]|nr:MerR family DNA-binding transcriptional regulator [Deltaproteobacteria bacterium]